MNPDDLSQAGMEAANRMNVALWAEWCLLVEQGRVPPVVAGGATLALLVDVVHWLDMHDPAARVAFQQALARVAAIQP